MTADVIAPQPGTDRGLPQPLRGMAIVAVLSAMTLVVLDAGMANVALPTLAHALKVTAGDAVLVVTAYQTGLLMALLPAAALGERFGDSRVFRTGVAVFLSGSLFCALSPSLPWLVAARFLQGLGGSAVMALGVALLRASVRSNELGVAVGWNALAVALASAAAPTLGALIVAGLDWPWLFLVNLPVGLVTLTASWRLPRLEGRARRLDLTSMALNGAGFALLVLGAEFLPRQPALSVLLFSLAAAGLGALVWRESSRSAPLVPLDLLGEPSFRLSVAASIFCFTAQAAGLVALPFFLQHDLGLSPLATGACLSPWPLTVAVASRVAGRLSDRLPTAWLCAAGAATLALGLLLLSLWPLRASPQPLLLFAAICGLGFGLFQVPNNRNLFMSAPPHRSGAAGGMQGTARLTGQTAGAVLMTLLFASTPVIAAPRIGLAIGGGFALLAGAVSLLRAPNPKRGQAQA